jgi:hypothetical protein
MFWMNLTGFWAWISWILYISMYLLLIPSIAVTLVGYIQVAMDNSFKREKARQEKARQEAASGKKNKPDDNEETQEDIADGKKGDSFIIYFIILF